MGAVEKQRRIRERDKAREIEETDVDITDEEHCEADAQQKRCGGRMQEPGGKQVGE